MRQILSFLCVTGLLVVLSACGGGATTAPATETAIVPVTGATEVPTVMATETVAATDTAMAPAETSTTEATAAATSETPASSSTSTTSGLGIKLDDVKSVMQGTGQFEFSDGTVDNQPASIAKLASSAASNFPTLAAGFSAAFIGDPANLSQIKITLPRSADNPGLEESVKVLTLMLAGILPSDVQSQFLTWMNQNFKDIPEGGSKDTTVGNFKFTFTRSATDMVLDIVPAQ